MAIKKTQVITYSNSYICDVCNEGEMLPTGFVLTSNPPKYPHRCNKCGTTMDVSGIKYPYISYEPVNANND